jgi:hypothetical protein
VTVAVKVIFSFTFAGLGVTMSAIALTDAGTVAGSADCATATTDNIEKPKPATSTNGNVNRHKDTLSFISYLGKGM